MTHIYFITHPEVQFDWQRPVTQWDLSETGQARLQKLLQQPWIKYLEKIFSSRETKAITTAQRIAQAIGIPVEYLPDLGEIDRSAAGTLPPAQYDAVTTAFFARPHESAHGWETAIHAQQRIVHAVEQIRATIPPKTNAAIISHGGVGTLLLCHLKQIPIARTEDQPGQGHFFVFDSTGKLRQGWQRIDDANR